MNQTKNTLKIEMRGDCEIVTTRMFNASREMLWDAWTKPELIKKWLLGPDGWTMPVCEVDLRVGGKYRFVWARAKDEMGMGGIYREVAHPSKIVNDEAFDVSWYEGGCLVTLELMQKGNQTLQVSTMKYDSKKVRDEVFKGPMSQGLVASYDRLEKIISSL